LLKNTSRDTLDSIDASTVNLTISFIHQPDRRFYHATFEMSEALKTLTKTNKILKSKLIEIQSETESMIDYVQKVLQIFKIYVKKAKEIFI
jgi:hypothetical protein